MARFDTGDLREHWDDWKCADGRMVTADFGPDRIRVAPATAEAWQALARVMTHHDYRIRTADTDSYNCRAITGGSGPSLHSFGIALDVNWKTNPFLSTPDGREVRFSRRRSQDARAEDVMKGEADTDMTAAMIRDVRAIATVEGHPVFTWGGDWNSIKDAMHFQIDLTPDEMEAGLDWSTVAGEVVVPETHPLFPRRGHVGPVVEYLQRRLARLSPEHPGPADGHFGPKTAASVAAFQASRTPAVDEGEGYFGPWTLSELDAAEGERVADS